MKLDPMRWMIHFCPLDPMCKPYDPPWRLAFRVPGWYVSIALRPQDKFAGKIDLELFKRTGKVRPLGPSRWTSVSRSKET